MPVVGPNGGFKTLSSDPGTPNSAELSITNKVSIWALKFSTEVLPDLKSNQKLLQYRSLKTQQRVRCIACPYIQIRTNIIYIYIHTCMYTYVYIHIHIHTQT